MTTNIREILPIQSVSYKTTEMYMFLINKLKAMGIQYKTENGNIYAVKNPYKAEIIPCFVSHIDTVHAITDEIHVLEFYEGRILTGFNRKKMSQTGIGGDDKVGIYYCLRALEELDAVKVAFFRDEEVGCNGSKEANMDFFKDVSMVLQGDRKGNSDFVTKISGIELSDKTFQNDVESIVKNHGYTFCTFGGTTDVGQLRKNGITVPVVNISCGYFNPHSKDEYIDMVFVENGLEMYLEIAKTYGKEYYYVEKHVPYVAPPVKQTYVAPPVKQTYVAPPSKPTYTAPQKETEVEELVYCAEINDMVSINDVIWSQHDNEYILRNWTTTEKTVDDVMDDFFDYWEIQVTPGYYEGVIVKKGSNIEQILDQAIAQKLITTIQAKNVVDVTKIARDIFNNFYGDLEDENL